MKTKLFLALGLTLYAVLMSVVLVWADASLVVVTAMLFGAPIFVLWNRLALRSHLVPVVATFTLLGAGLLQLYAYKSGLWYELSPLNFKAFGGAPVEAYVFSVVHILYFIILYEFFFDDSKSLLRTKFSARSLAGLGLVYTLFLGYIYAEPTLFVRHPFAFLLLVLGSILALLVMIKRVVPKCRVFFKAGVFALAMLPLSLIYEWVLVVNGIRLFANTHEYLYYFVWQGSVVPLEEIVLLLFIPFGLVVLYELYLDDSQ